MIKKLHLTVLIFCLACMFSTKHVNAQKAKADSLSLLLASERADTSRVKLMWQLAEVLSNYDVTKALQLSNRALHLARKINYDEGTSRSLGIIVNTFINIGNYPKALEFCFRKLRFDEVRTNYRNIASVLMNIAVVYSYQEEFKKALSYYYQSDSVIQRHKIESLQYYSWQNLGDVYDRLNITDSSYYYFTKAMQIAKALDDYQFVGASMTGLGHTYSKIGNYNLADSNYKAAITYLQAYNNDDLLCEAMLGLARLYKEMNKNDSAAYYARRSFTLAKQDGFLSRELEAAAFLTKHFSSVNKVDSAFVYLSHVKALNDSLNSRARIRESQIISSNEQLRQIEIEAARKAAHEERRQQLQLLFIGMFIPGFFIVTLLLSRVKINVKAIKAMGVLSLLFVFEYLTLLLHPRVVEFTHHTPVFELAIFVSIAAVLIPLHHRIEHWLIRLLIRRKEREKVVLKQRRLKMKKPSTD